MASSSTTKASKTYAKQTAQDALMYGIGNVLGYWSEMGGYVTCPEGWTEDEFRAELQVQADRLAKVFGFDHAWAN